MTLEEAIAIMEDPTKHTMTCSQGELTEWFKELKELRESIGAVKLSNMKEALALIRTLKAELNGWIEDPFSIIAEVCRSRTDCIRCQWNEKCPFSKKNAMYESYPDEWLD